MERNRVLDEWNDLKDEVRRRWTKLTDEDVSNFGAALAALADTLQSRYGVAREHAHDEVRAFFARLHGDMRAAADHVRETATDLWQHGRDRMRAGVQAGRERVQERPLQALALAAAAGALAGMLLARRRK